ncbi:MAG: Zn-dependent protease [Rhodoferax sp.]|nr:Zn-dependent protease [Rhodoferax sp.]
MSAAPGRPKQARTPSGGSEDTQCRAWGHQNTAHDFINRVHAHFDQLCDHLLGQLRSGEELTLNLTAEETLFVRFNGNRVRQNTDVTQKSLSLRLQAQGRSMEKSRTLSGNFDADQAATARLLEHCRREALVLPIDPNQVPIQNNGASSEEFRGALLAPEQVVAQVVGPAQGCDLAGLYAGGTVIRANRNSKGQSHWFATETFFLDYSIYNGPQAAKGSYAGSHWNAGEWAANLARTKALLALLSKPQQDVKPGAYRTYLAPRAMSDLVGMMGWNALSAAAWKQGRSPFKKLAEKELRLSPLLSIDENFGLGLTPRFNNLGEVSATTLPLIEAGELQTLLVSSRTAKEYGLVTNGAADGESPRALDVRPGSLQEADILQALDTGLYLSNLHYLNWSDPVSARVTGMTRYACFWVEGGEIVGPIKDLRWDESLYSALGSKLMALTAQAEIDPAVDTYFQRALGGSRSPGALIDGFTFTL